MSDKKLADALRAIEAAERAGRAFTVAERDAMRAALAAYDARTFADEMYALADRAMATVRQQTGPTLSLNQVSRLVELAKLTIAIGNDADDKPKSYKQ